MLSILIPTYNYNITQLVFNIHKQCEQSSFDFEVLVYDDASSSNEIIKKNSEINKLPHTTYKVLPKNIGRSAIRNLLAKEANHDWLLFLDADVFPKNLDFIVKYINSIKQNSEIIYGGILYEEKTPDKNELLRWIYGKKREALTVEQRNKNPYLSFLTLNFLIKKTVFSKVSFNEDIPNLRHEDTLFSYNLKTKHINIEHVQNPVYHYGLESSETFLKKSLEALEALHLFLEQDLIPWNYTKITRIFYKLKKYKVTSFFRIFFKIFKDSFEKNLLSKNPSLFIFDLYRLSYLCKITKTK